MRKLLVVSAVIAAFCIQPVLAADRAGMKACASMASACKNAGYVRNGGVGKMFWFSCMRPLLLNKTVTGVTVNPASVKMCRMLKINETQKELAALQKAATN